MDRIQPKFPYFGPAFKAESRPVLRRHRNVPKSRKVTGEPWPGTVR